MTDEPREQPKIIIDEDWKTRVERERDEARERDPGTTTTADKPQASPQDAGFDAEQLPAASLELLVTTIATQTMAALGQFPDPAAGQPEIHLALAKHHIDTLAVLEEKTKGNLSTEEAQQLDTVLHQLRMLYFAIQQQS